MSNLTFAGKLAIVTGSSKQNGIGFATAYALAKGGADIVIHYNSNAAAAQQSADKIKELGVQAITVQADASSPTFGSAIVQATVKAFPGRSIDIIVNNAGAVTLSEGTANLVEGEFDMLFHANVRGPDLLIRAALPHIPAPGGRIINIGSVLGWTGTRFAAYYAASKGALNIMTLAWADELGEKGITVNVIAPGPIATDYAPPEEHELTKKLRSAQHTKRNGTADEVASAILFVASAGASFVSGQVLGVDGGHSYA